MYLITDRRACGARSLVEVIGEALAAIPPGAAWVQLREKDLDGAALLSLARELVKIVHARNGKLFVNDRIDVALAANADGVHLPERGFDLETARALAPGLMVGVSTHDVDRARAMLHTGAAPVLYGPVWATPSKPQPLGLDDMPAGVFAIGGITDPDRAREARAAGARGVACIRAVMAAEDPGAAARAMVEALS